MTLCSLLTAGFGMFCEDISCDEAMSKVVMGPVEKVRLGCLSVVTGNQAI